MRQGFAVLEQRAVCQLRLESADIRQADGKILRQRAGLTQQIDDGGLQHAAPGVGDLVDRPLRIMHAGCSRDQFLPVEQPEHVIDRRRADVQPLAQAALLDHLLNFSLVARRLGDEAQNRQFDFIQPGSIQGVGIISR